MDLIELKNRIVSSFSGSKPELEDILRIVEEDQSIFPFNEFEHLFAIMVDRRKLTFDDYVSIRAEYIGRNPNLWVFEISAPRGFGEGFAQTYLQGKCPALRKPTKVLDKDYSGEYDFWLDGVRVEVKASRAVDSSVEAPLYVKALSRSSGLPFLMNFQQLKPQLCDVFVWLAAFRDEIVVWVLSSTEVLKHPGYSKGQHRGNAGNEGQLHVKDDNVHTLEKYELRDGDLGRAILEASKRT